MADGDDDFASRYDKPNIPEKCRAGLIAANAKKPLANADPEEVLKRLRSGESVRQLAASLGISHESTYEWLLRNCPEDWVSISAAKSLARMEKAEEAMDDADDNVKVAKARESHRMGAWTLERVARALYGDNKGQQGGVTINVHLDPAAGLTIEGQA